MPHSFGYRARTRDKFSKPFRKFGAPHMSSFLTTYRINDFVDIVVNGAIHKGMPHHYYHGRTGRVFNVTKRAVGVELLKQVGGRFMSKRIHVRVEHVRPSRCREDFLKRVKVNDRLKAKAHKEGVTPPVTKRTPGAVPKEGFFVTSQGKTPETVQPIPFEFLF